MKCSGTKGQKFGYEQRVKRKQCEAIHAAEKGKEAKKKNSLCY